MDTCKCRNRDQNWNRNHRFCRVDDSCRSLDLCQHKNFTSQSQVRESEKQERHTLVTEDASPSVFAVAFEWTATSAVQAARIFHAAITMRSFPSETTSDSWNKEREWFPMKRETEKKERRRRWLIDEWFTGARYADAYSSCLVVVHHALVIRFLFLYSLAFVRLIAEPVFPVASRRTLSCESKHIEWVNRLLGSFA